MRPRVLGALAVEVEDAARGLVQGLLERRVGEGGRRQVGDFRRALAQVPVCRLGIEDLVLVAVVMTGLVSVLIKRRMSAELGGYAKFNVEDSGTTGEPPQPPSLEGTVA